MGREPRARTVVPEEEAQDKAVGCPKVAVEVKQVGLERPPPEAAGVARAPLHSEDGIAQRSFAREGDDERGRELRILEETCGAIAIRTPHAPR